jgi:hypothetical protein
LRHFEPLGVDTLNPFDRIELPQPDAPSHELWCMIASNEHGAGWAAGSMASTGLASRYR